MSKRRVYLDACLFIAMQRPDRKPSPEVMDAIRSLLDNIEHEKDFGISSSIMVAELLDGSYDVFLKCFDGKKGELEDVTPSVAGLARNIRNKIIRDKARLEVADCIHLATALIWKCDVLVTIDGLDSTKHRLLTSAADIRKHYGLNVVSPVDAVDQRILDIQVPPDDGSSPLKILKPKTKPTNP